MGYLQQEMINKMENDMNTQVKVEVMSAEQIEIGVLNDEIKDLKRQVEACKASIESHKRVITLLSAFGRHMHDTSEPDDERDALEAAMVAAGMDRDWALDVLCDYGVTSRGAHEREYNISVTIPVYFSMTIMAQDEDNAHEKAMDEVNNMWLSDIIDGYACDFDGSEVEITYVEEN